jgi:hypothetical protein
MAEPPTPLVVDINCFIRFLDWRPRPLVGAEFAGYQLVSTKELAGEATKSKNLLNKYPALTDPAMQQELKSGVIKLSAADLKAVKELAEDLRTMGQDLVTRHCADQKTPIRRISAMDAAAWATGMHVGGALATDEWPLAYAAGLIGDDDGRKVTVVTSIKLLQLLEQAGRLTAVERWNTMRQWRVEDERLPRDADNEYWTLFGEAPPNAQSKRK